MRNRKKAVWILLTVLLAAGIGIWVISFVYNNTVHFPENASVTVHWTSIYDSNEHFTQILSPEEAAAVVRIFNGYSYEFLGDGAGCPLNERLTATIGDTVFYLGQDGCQIIEHAQTGRIFEMRYEDWSALDAIFQKYGGKLG